MQQSSTSTWYTMPINVFIKTNQIVHFDCQELVMYAYQ